MKFLDFKKFDFKEKINDYKKIEHIYVEKINGIAILIEYKNGKPVLVRSKNKTLLLNKVSDYIPNIIEDKSSFIVQAEIVFKDKNLDPAGIFHYFYYGSSKKYNKEDFDIFAYNINLDLFQIEKFELLKRYGFKVLDYKKFEDKVSYKKDRTAWLENFNKTFPYRADGLIFYIKNTYTQKETLEAFKF